MYREQDLIELAQRETDGEQVLVAGVFHPRGTAIASAIPGIGAIAGGPMAAEARDEPWHTMLAVGPVHLFAFVLNDVSVGWEIRERFGVWERSAIHVTAHNRISVRTLEIDDRNGHRYEFEAPRLGEHAGWHGGAVIRLLVAPEDGGGEGGEA